MFEQMIRNSIDDNYIFFNPKKQQNSQKNTI